MSSDDLLDKSVYYGGDCGCSGGAYGGSPVSESGVLTLAGNLVGLDDIQKGSVDLRSNGLNANGIAHLAYGVWKALLITLLVLLIVDVPSWALWLVGVVMGVSLAVWVGAEVMLQKNPSPLERVDQGLSA
jgi:hypothetical protein